MLVDFICNKLRERSFENLINLATIYSMPYVMRFQKALRVFTRVMIDDGILLVETGNILYHPNWMKLLGILFLRFLEIPTHRTRSKRTDGELNALLSEK